MPSIVSLMSLTWSSPRQSAQLTGRNGGTRSSTVYDLSLSAIFILPRLSLRVPATNSNRSPPPSASFNDANQGCPPISLPGSLLLFGLAGVRAPALLPAHRTVDTVLFRRLVHVPGAHAVALANLLVADCRVFLRV